MSTLTTPPRIMNWREAENRFGRLADAFLSGTPTDDNTTVTIADLNGARAEADRLMDVALNLARG